jgi:gliding motility-associated-like protein
VVENINEHFDVFIYNRFSKLLASYRGDFAGWDGIYNGKEQPTDDYWYVIIDRLKNKQYSGHFTLKR